MSADPTSTLRLADAWREEPQHPAPLGKSVLRRPPPRKDARQEKSVPLPSRSTRVPHAASDCAVEVPPGLGDAGSVWSSAGAERVDAKTRLSRLAHALESDVIPQLVGAHVRVPRAAIALEPREIAAFVDLLRHAGEAELDRAVGALHQRGLTVEALFLEVFAPAARYLNDLWLADRCDFSSVTVCLGRLQGLLRTWSPTFGAEVKHPVNGRRILLAQHPDEQHSFGLSMVAEFFRRDGWEVLGGVGGAVRDPSAQVAREWFDAVGFSIGSETRIDWLRERIAQVRRSTRNRAVVVLVGGPVFVLQPGWAQSVGADASGHEGGRAPQLAESLLSDRHRSR